MISLATIQTLLPSSGGIWGPLPLSVQGSRFAAVLLLSRRRLLGMLGRLGGRAGGEGIDGIDLAIRQRYAVSLRRVSPSPKQRSANTALQNIKHSLSFRGFFFFCQEKLVYKRRRLFRVVPAAAGMILVSSVHDLNLCSTGQPPALADVNLSSKPRPSERGEKYSAYWCRWNKMMSEVTKLRYLHEIVLLDGWQRIFFPPVHY